MSEHQEEKKYSFDIDRTEVEETEEDRRIIAAINSTQHIKEAINEELKFINATF